MKRISPVSGESRWERYVRCMMNSCADGDVGSWMKDLRYGGCASGMVGPLVYTADVVRVLGAHIDEVLEVLTDELGPDGPRHNPEVLLWTAFELTADRIARDAGLED